MIEVSNIEIVEPALNLYESTTDEVVEVLRGTTIYSDAAHKIVEIVRSG